MIRDAQKDAPKDSPNAKECQGDSLSVNPGAARNPLAQGVATEVFNPKTALFFLSFIPQFVNRGVGHVFLQFVVLGTVSVILNTSADMIVVLMAGPLGKQIRSSAVFRRRQRTVTGAIMIGLGTYLASSESR
jgi:threonine/homoserine/homoserine lactone efflux protein